MTLYQSISPFSVLLRCLSLLSEQLYFSWSWWESFFLFVCLFGTDNECLHFLLWVFFFCTRWMNCRTFLMWDFCIFIYFRLYVLLGFWFGNETDEVTMVGFHHCHNKDFLIWLKVQRSKTSQRMRWQQINNSTNKWYNRSAFFNLYRYFSNKHTSVQWK